MGDIDRIKELVEGGVWVTGQMVRQSWYQYESTCIELESGERDFDSGNAKLKEVYEFLNENQTPGKGKDDQKGKGKRKGKGKYDRKGEDRSGYNGDYDGKGREWKGYKGDDNGKGKKGGYKVMAKVRRGRAIRVMIGVIITEKAIMLSDRRQLTV